MDGSIPHTLLALCLVMCGARCASADLPITREGWFYAAEIGHRDAVREAIAAQMEVNIVNDRKETALHVALGRGHYLVARDLVRAGISVKETNHQGETALQVMQKKRRAPASAPGDSTAQWIEANVFRGLVERLQRVAREEVDFRDLIKQQQNAQLGAAAAIGADVRNGRRLGRAVEDSLEQFPGPGQQQLAEVTKKIQRAANEALTYAEAVFGKEDLRTQWVEWYLNVSTETRDARRRGLPPKFKNQFAVMNIPLPIRPDVPPHVTKLVEWVNSQGGLNSESPLFVFLFAAPPPGFTEAPIERIKLVMKYYPEFLIPELCREQDAMTSLHLALAADMPELASFLLQHGADPNYASWQDVYLNNHGRLSPLICACTKETTRVVAIALDHGADPNYVGYGLDHDSLETNAIIHAAGNIEVLKLLVAAGADLESPVRRNVRIGQQLTSRLMTPLMVAAAAGDANTTSALLSLGAIKSTRIYDGLTAEEFANLKGHKEVARMLAP